LPVTKGVSGYLITEAADVEAGWLRIWIVYFFKNVLKYEKQGPFELAMNLQ